MKNMLAYVCAVAGITLAALQVQAESLVDGSADDGKSKSVTCAACHGAAGISANPLWPNVAGQNAPYLVAQLKAFKEGSRKNPLMTSQAMMLSDEPSPLLPSSSTSTSSSSFSSSSSSSSPFPPRLLPTPLLLLLLLFLFSSSYSSSSICCAS